MKKVNIILIILNILVIIGIIVKCLNQNITIEYKIENNISKKDIEYEIMREILHNEKSKYSEFNEDGFRINTSEEIKKSQILDDGLIIKDYKISYKNNFTQIVATIYNSSDEEKGGYPAKLNFFDEENQKILVLDVYVNKILAGVESKIVTGITQDISDVYRCEIEKVEGE